MRSRFVAGWKGLVLAAAMASLALLPVGTFAASGPTAVVGSDSGFSAAPAENQPLKQLPLYARSNYTWPFAAGPTYGTVDESLWSARGVLHFAVGSFDTSDGLPNFPAELRTGVKLDKLPAQYFVLQLDPQALAGGSYEALRDAVDSNGGAIVSNLAVVGFIARLTPAAYAAVQGVPGLIFVEPYHPALKLSPTIGRAPLTDPVKALSSVYSLVVKPFAGEDPNAVAQQIAAIGGTVTAVWADAIKVDLGREKLVQLAAIEAVEIVFEDVPNYPHGEETTTTVQTGQWNGGAIPYHDVGITGGGLDGASPQMVMVLDSGIQLDGGDLSNTKTDAGTPGALHRKVRDYKTTTGFGGSGDLFGCDAPVAGGFTHGHVVSGTALGNATATPTSYGGSWVAYLPVYSMSNWKLDGVAPRAKLVAYDANITSTTTSCEDPAVSGIYPGNLYTAGSLCGAPTSGSLSDAYCSYAARLFNFSWGQLTPGVYSGDSSDVDDFMAAAGDAVVFISAGNSAQDLNGDGRPDPGSIGSPATAKNGVVVGASGNANDGGAPYQTLRAYFSSVGPATTTSNRVAPLLMAPGYDPGTLGLPSEFVCRTSDNDQSNPVECDISIDSAGTSFAAPAAAGAGALIRDYFAQGFYPDGTASNPANSLDQVPNLSAALVKAILIDSAEFLDYPGPGLIPSSRNPTQYRFNNEQGYGRIQLNKALPLQTYASPVGLIVADGGIVGGKNNTSLSGAATAGADETYPFTISDTTQELRVALAWMDPVGDTLVNNLDLELVSPTGKVYYGNYFTDDNDRDRQCDVAEDCGDGIWTLAGYTDNSRWSLPTCAGSVRDTQNPTEAIFLSPDPKFDGDPAKNQIEAGTWTLHVKGTTVTGIQPYAVAIAGPVQLGSSAQLEVFRGGEQVVDIPSCNDTVRAVVDELNEATDPTPSAAEVSSRATIEVYDATNALVDSESGLSFTQVGTSLRFETSLLILTDGTARDPGNRALDIRHGDTIKVVYRDETSGVADPNKVRTNQKKVDCQASIAFGGTTFWMFGKDAAVYVSGGCERDARNQFYWDAPDQYMDEAELIDFRMAISTSDTLDLEDAEATLTAVYPDDDSPVTCLPNSTSCADPNRENNTSIPDSILAVLDSPKMIGFIPSSVKSLPNSAAVAPALTVNFTIQMGADITGIIPAEMILGISARKSGRPVAGLAVYRTSLNADESAINFSTDFPTGGTQLYDWNNNESIENPTRFLGDVNFQYDYRFETVTWGDLTAGGTRNTSISAPWNFDSNNGGFRSGIVGKTNANIATAIALWGEDKNFNNLLDSGEDRDPANSVLDQNWGLLGGCGWQTKGTNTYGGVWHTGRISATTNAQCLVTGSTTGQCQATETYPGTTGQSYWWEVLETPKVKKVRVCTTGTETGCDGRIDAENAPVYKVQFTNWAWNMLIDMPDTYMAITWELDTDADKLAPVSLETDESIFNILTGNYGAVSAGNDPLTNGFPVFADFTATGSALSKNGTIGGNREGDNGCFFESSKDRTPNYGFALPKDDDLRNGWCYKVGDPTDKQNPCTVATAATDCPAPEFNGTCVLDPAASTDLYVYKNGPLRNMNLEHVNGWIDGRFYTLEDIYGDSGSTFQGAVGMIAYEGTTTAPASGFGVSVDDMVLEWKESTVIPDPGACAAVPGNCATIATEAGSFFSGLAVLTITVTDSSTATTANDCDHDGLYTGTEDDWDCNDNGINDVVVWAFNENEPAGEYVVLDETTRAGVFEGTLPVSLAYNSPGTLFIQKSGTQDPYVNVQYMDLDDGTGTICKNNPDPTKWGYITTYADFPLQSGSVIITASRIVNVYGDGDGFADTNETVDMYITVSNKTGADVTNVVARMAANDPKIDCIVQPIVIVGTVPKGSSVESATAFRFKVAGDANRTAISEDYYAELAITISADQFDATVQPQTVIQDLDLNFTGGGTAQTFTESFESGTSFGSFTTMSLDLNIADNTLSDGMRCQYNDPDYENSASYNEKFCYLGFAKEDNNTYDWHVHATTSPDGGRAYVGTQSLHWGYHRNLADADEDCTKFSQMDAIRLNNPVYLGYSPVTPGTPELSFKHQAAFMDYRTVNALFMQAPDRGIVALQLADSAGSAVGDWKKLYPYENMYDIQHSNNYINCCFDPIDDGNTEDDYFLPEDPDRWLGPSSMCFPEFNFGSIGDTDYRNAYIPGSVQRASDDLIGLRGSIDRGTWIQSKFNIERFRGRPARIRFATSTIKVSDTVDWISLGFEYPNPLANGWFIDDIVITNTMSAPATASVDGTDNSGLPACPANCTVVTAQVSATPSTLAAPGQVTTVDASTSYADACIDGVLQYQFWIDGDLDGTAGTVGDTLLRDWSDNAIFVDAPNATTQYAVAVRCSQALACVGSSATLVTVNCPASGNLSWVGPLLVGKTGGLLIAEPDQNLTLSWATSQTTDVIRGNLIGVRSTATFTNTVQACILNDSTATSVADSTAITAGQALYFLARTPAGLYCNILSTYSSGAVKEKAGRDTQIAADPNRCP